MAWNRVKSRLEEIESKVGEVFYLDLIRYREVSAFVADFFNVRHESPQVLVIQGTECIYDTSHLDIRPEEILSLELPLSNT